jgi:hypothetical protein
VFAAFRVKDRRGIPGGTRPSTYLVRDNHRPTLEPPLTDEGLAAAWPAPAMNLSPIGQTDWVRRQIIYGGRLG